MFFPDADSTPATAIAAVEQAAAAEGLITVPGARLVRLDPDDIVPNAAAAAQQLRPRRPGGARAQRPRVRRAAADRRAPASRPAGKYELVMGERRLRATKAAGLDTIPAVVKDTADEDMLRDALLENLHRSQLNPLEEASAYQQLLADFGITQEELASRIGRSRPQISNTLRLLKLPEPVQHRVAAGVLSAGHARAILSLGDDPEAMQRLADKIVNEDLSVRAAEAIATSEPKASRAKPAAGKRQDFLDDLAEPPRRPANTRVKIALAPEKARSALISRPFRTSVGSSRISARSSRASDRLGCPGSFLVN